MSNPITGKFVVLNGAQSPITKIVATHLCVGHTDLLEADSLAPGQTSAAFVLNAKTSHDDRWTVTFTMNNNPVSGKAKCDYKQHVAYYSGKDLRRHKRGGERNFPGYAD